MGFSGFPLLPAGKVVTLSCGIIASLVHVDLPLRRFGDLCLKDSGIRTLLQCVAASQS